MKPEVAKQLTLLRQQFIHAKNHAKSNTRLGRVQAVLGCDLCVELFLNIVLTSQGEQKPKEQGFYKLWKEAGIIYEKATELKLPLYAEMDGLHKNRNLIQHHGEAPDQETAEKYIPLTEAFLKESVKALFEVDFEGVTQADAISDEKVRGDIKKAEEFLESRNFDKAYINAIIGFERSIRIKSRQLSERKAVSTFLADDIARIIGPKQFTPSAISDNMRIQAGFRELVEAVRNLEQRIRYLSLKIDIAKYLKMRKRDLGIHWTLDDEPKIDITGDFAVDEEAAKEMINFATESILQLEEI